MLHDPGDTSIELVVNFDFGSDLERRFLGRTHEIDDAAETEEAASLPEVMWFADIEGIVCLLSPYGHSWQIGSRPNEGRVRFRYAVRTDDPTVDYRTVQRLESRLHGLEWWYPRGSLRIERERTEQESRVVSLRLQSGSTTRIAPVLNAVLRPTFFYSVTPIPGESAIEDMVYISTRREKRVTIEGHLRVHLAVRDLVAISSWSDCRLWGLRAVATGGRSTVGPSSLDDWVEVETPMAARGPSDVRRRFLFSFDDLGPGGMYRWFRLAEDYSRGIQQMIAGIDSSGVSLEAQLLNAGSGLEHLGHRILERAGSETPQGFRSYLRAIVGELRCELPFDLDRWVERAANVYRDVKHADRTDPAPLVMAEALRTMRIVFRVWVAERLRADPTVISRNFRLLPARSSLDSSWLS